MLRFYFVLCVALFIHIRSTQAYEFQKINYLFNLLQTEYSENIDLNQISSVANKTLSLYDSQIKLYSSHTKTFLYYKNKLVSQFTLPKKDASAVAWQNLVINIFTDAIKSSNRLNEHATDIESTFLNLISQHLDKFSRIEKVSETSLSPSWFATMKHNSLYIKLTSFVDGQTEKLKQVITQYPNIDGIILDLRGNHGGQFNEALKFADLFLDNAIITYSQEKNHPKRYYVSHAGDILSGKPIAILTDEFTASSAEIVVTALKEQSRAILIGSKTFGKNSIQSKHQIDNEILYLTSGHFYSPSGAVIGNIGVKPQICTAIDDQCLHSDVSHPEKDITIALEFIKNSVS